MTRVPAQAKEAPVDERQLRAMHRAAQPVLQRTAPSQQQQSRLPLTPALLDQLAWNVVLAYVANVAERPPQGLPHQAKSGEAALPGEQVRAAVERLRAATLRLRPRPAALARFSAAAGRLLEAYGWAPQKAAQAAAEMAEALQGGDGY